MKRRKLLVLIALGVKQRGECPSWAALRAALGVGRFKFASLMESLRRDGLVTYDEDVPGSARVTPAGLRLAVRG